MLKKFGMVSVGITAGLLAVAPMASATEGHHGSDQEGTGNIQCAAEGGDLDNDATGGDADGELAGIGGVGQAAGPVLSNNTGQALSCNSFLNDVANDNEINIASSLL